MTQRARLAAVIVADVAVLSGGARADDSPSAAAPAPQRVWYGWETLAADAAAAATLAVASAEGSRSLAVLGVVGYLADGPVIHGLNGHRSLAGTSALLRVAAPTVGALIGFLLASGQCSKPSNEDDTLNVSSCVSGDVAVGALVFMGAASIIDAARATTRPGDVEPPLRRDRGLAWAPVVAPTSGGTTFGLVGRF